MSAERDGVGARVLRFWATPALDAAARRVRGHALPYADELLRTYGLAETLRGLDTLRRVGDELVRQHGERDAHTLWGMAGLRHGCEYTARGHLLAAGLHHFRATGETFPLDDSAVDSLWDLADARGVERVRALIAGEGYARLLGLIERQFGLWQGSAEGILPEDEALGALMAACEWAAECSARVRGADAPPLGHVARDVALREAYDRARATPRTPR